jgi:hypothetical protein
MIPITINALIEVLRTECLSLGDRYDSFHGPRLEIKTTIAAECRIWITKMTLGQFFTDRIVSAYAALSNPRSEASST